MLENIQLECIENNNRIQSFLGSEDESNLDSDVKKERTLESKVPLEERMWRPVEPLPPLSPAHPAPTIGA